MSNSCLPHAAVLHLQPDDQYFLGRIVNRVAIRGRPRGRMANLSDRLLLGGTEPRSPEMLSVETAANMQATFIALRAASQGAPPRAAAAIHFSLLPYNVFLFAAVGRASPRSHVASMVSLFWLALITAVQV